MKRKLFLLSILITSILLVFFLIYPEKKPDKTVRIDKIVVEKSKRRMYVYANGKIIKTYKISLGGNPVGKKQFEGDKKTPEGLYLINDKNPKSICYKNLGISYPNPQDIKNARKSGKKAGGLIKIHGITNGYGWLGKLHILIDWTAGCIAVTNSEMDELYNSVEQGTPVEIKP